MESEQPERPDWQAWALEHFPEFDEEIREADTPYLLWIGLRTHFEDAYATLPFDDSLIGRIYQFYKWCSCHPRGETAADDLLTCVFVCFYEHIPEDKNALKDARRWLPADEFDRLLEFAKRLAFGTERMGWSENLER